MPEDNGSPRSEKAERRTRESREVRERQILEATVRCMRRTGFHAASVVQIAQEAGLSVGVIYRYFESKEAILEAIAERDLAEMQSFFANMEGIEPALLRKKLISEVSKPIERQYDRPRTAMLLDIFAEASRNPRVEAIMQRIDERGRRLGKDLIRRLNPESHEESEIEIRNEMIRILMDGMLIRGVLNPHIDRQKLANSFRSVMKFITEMKEC